MTRCYGWSLPHSMLIPFADCLNHHYLAVDHCMVDMGNEIENKNEKYTIKKNKIDLDLLGLKN